MTYDRNEIARGRGQVQFGGQTLFAQGDIAVSWAHDTFKINTGNHGNVDTRDKDRYVTITLTPTGRVTSSLLGVLYPHLDKSYAAKALGANDAAAVVYLEGSGRKITVHNAVIFKMPDLNLTTGQTPFGQVILHGLVKNATAPEAADAYYTEAQGVYPGDAAFDVAEVTAGMFSGAWGDAAPWDEFYSQNGFRVSFNVPLSPIGPDGTRRDYSVGNQTIKVTASPMEVGVDDIAAKVEPKYQGATAPLGGVSMLVNADDLVISNADIHFILYGADIEDEGAIADPTKDEAGSLTWMADRQLSGGAATAVAYIGTAAPA